MVEHTYNNIKVDFLEAYSIVSAIPKSWKNAIKDYGDRLELVKSLKIEELSMPNIEWKTYYYIPFCCTVQTKLQSF